jgi:tripartite-type tricarboxylate transporter receptor subunit TctC
MCAEHTCNRTGKGGRWEERIMGNASLRVVALALLLFGIASPAVAEDVAAYPSKPIRVIIANPPGAGSDVGGRLVSEVAEKHLGQRLVVENKPGAGGRIGAAFVSRSAPDGYTILYSPKPPITIVQHLKLKLDYDPVRDLTPVAIMTWAPGFLIVRKSFPAATVQEFLAYAKANPGKITLGIQGIGGEFHVTLEVLRQIAGVKITAIPYIGGSPAIIDLLAERLDSMFLVPAAITQHLAEGRLRALATLEPKRVPAYPDVPTMAEAGLPQVTSSAWFGFTAPAATPKPIIEKLAAAFAKTQGDAAVVKKLAAVGYALRVLGPADSAAVFAKEREQYGKIAEGGRLDKAN